jgi:N-acetylmuramoyl-L-alanine amidase
MEITNIVDELPKHAKEKYRTRKLKDIKRIVVHHSATVDTATPRSFAAYHVDHNKWPGIGYHYVITKDGTIYKTNNDSTVSWHAGPTANRDSIGICLVGWFDKGMPPEPQWKATIELVKHIRKAYNIPVSGVIGHREVPKTSKSCPGWAIDLNALRSQVR